MCALLVRGACIARGDVGCLRHSPRAHVLRCKHLQRPTVRRALCVQRPAGDTPSGTRRLRGPTRHEASALEGRVAAPTVAYIRDRNTRTHFHPYRLGDVDDSDPQPPPRTAHVARPPSGDGGYFSDDGGARRLRRAAVDVGEQVVRDRRKAAAWHDMVRPRPAHELHGELLHAQWTISGAEPPAPPAISPVRASSEVAER
jgi:hypothetical protein